MKKILKFIFSTLCYTLFLPSVLLLIFCASWYILPALQQTDIGQLLINNIGQNTIFILSICSVVLCIFFGLMGKVFNVIKSSKVNNFYTHLLTWLTAIFMFAVSVYSFVASGDVLTSDINLTPVRKIGILACAIAMLLYAILSPKIRVLVHRRIQAYDTAKELNANGRSSVVGMQILKCLDFICPEMFLLVAMCFSFDWNISIYFVYIIVAFILPLIGNMICDKRVKVEAQHKHQQEHQAIVNDVAAVVASQIAIENHTDNVQVNTNTDINTNSNDASNSNVSTDNNNNNK